MCSYLIHSDQLKFMKNNPVENTPHFKPMDDVDRLNNFLHKTDGSRMTFSEHDLRTHKRQAKNSHHTRNPYAGVPCAAYCE